jgi:hypothetical protein
MFENKNKNLRTLYNEARDAIKSERLRALRISNLEIVANDKNSEDCKGEGKTLDKEYYKLNKSA